MRIAIEAQRVFRTNKHGMDFVALECVKELQKIDKVNEYYIIVGPGEDREVLTETDNFHIVEVNFPTYPLWEQVGLPMALKRIKPHILHCTSNTAPLLGNVPLVLTLHDIIFLEKKRAGNRSLYQSIGWYYRRLVVPSILKKCKKIITVSNFEADTIRGFLGLTSELVVAVYNGFGSHFQRVENSREITALYSPFDEYIFFLGNTDPKKNSERVIEAYTIYREHSSLPLPLLIADLDRKFVLRTLNMLGKTHMAGFIHSPGYIPNKHLPHIYSGAKLFLYPSLRESFGIPILESMACGTPVITSNTSAMPEIAGDSAFIVNPFNAKEIADAMIKTEDKVLHKNLSDKGYERVKMFSWENSARQLLDIYNGLNNEQS